jgi:CMP-N-acetylneuraminic acid synthetase/spore coat polysaccharide biosynthesis predicted glycosyltransferase SpsG
MRNILVIIPARGGSKGIPRKNLRLLNGKPLIYYAIQTAISSKFKPDVYVTSEDDEILNLSMKFGAKIHKRPFELSNDSVTLDPVIFDAVQYIEKIENKTYDLIVTIQPTSPLLKTKSLDNAIELIINNSNIDTIISAKEITHLTWRKYEGKYIPNFEKRVNRQDLTPIYVETGGFLITRRSVISPDSRIGKEVELYILSGGEAIDIDSLEDWSICEFYLKQKNILFVVLGNEQYGLGHVYNSLILANALTEHKITFLVVKGSELAFKKISEYNYPVFMQKNDNILCDIKLINPDVVINDILDTDYEYIKNLKDLGIKVINFEDLGPGAKIADLVINPLYPEKFILPNHYFGYNYILLRDEFIYSPYKKIEDKVRNVLITFGGVDPNNLTKKVLDSIYNYCKKNNILITVITGLGYNKFHTIQEYKEIEIKNNISNISDYMLKADIIFSSAGRTVYEIASIGTPAIIMAQNERELTHFFASAEYGFINLGLGHNVTNEEILNVFSDLVNSFETRKYMNELMKKIDLKKGRENVLNLVKKVIGG